MLQVDKLATDGLGIIIYVEEAKATLGLTTAVGCTSWVKEELSVYLLIPGDMTMPKHNNTRIGEFLASHPRMRLRITQDMYNTDTAVTNNNLAFNWQFQDDLFILNVALDSHHGRYRFQLIHNRKDGEVTRMDDQLNILKMLPGGSWKLFEMWDVCIGNYPDFSGHVFSSCVYIVSLYRPVHIILQIILAL
jgi:hypothetical protein